MGAVKVMLAQKQLNDRELHNSRLFVDLCENIHIHFREYRFVFSLPEYFEFVDIVDKSTADVRNYLAQNPDYEERKYGTTLMVAGGKERQMKFLQRSPEPNRSSYFNNDLRIELQEEYVTDEIHIHYRDFRLCLNRANFRDIADAFCEAREALNAFESSNRYVRDAHRDRKIETWVQDPSVAGSDTPIMGTKEIPLRAIRSPWHSDMAKDWHPDPKLIEALRTAMRRGDRIAPVVLVATGDDDRYTIVDGHHRVRAAIDEGKATISAVLLKSTSFDQTKPLRQAEERLKEFDKATEYRFRTSEFFRSFIGYSLNDHYRDHFYHAVRKPNPLYRLLKWCKSVVLKMPLPDPARTWITGISGSKKYW